MLNKKFAAALAAVLTLTLSGCSSSGEEVNKRTFVQIMGLEKQADYYNVSLQFYKPESSDGNPDISKANSDSVTGRGTTITEALTDAELKTGKSVFTGHTKLLVLGDGLGDPSDELSVLYGNSAYGNVSPSCPVAYSKVPSAITETFMTEGLFSADRLIGKMESAVNNGRAFYTSVASLAESTEVSEAAAILPVIYAENENVYFSGGAFTDKNGIHGNLPESELYGMIILRNDFPDRCEINVPVTVNSITASASIVKAKCRKTAVYNEGRLEISAEICADIRINENTHGLDNERLVRAVSEKIKDSVVSAYSTAVWYNSCDIYGINKAVRRDCHEIYDELSADDSNILRNSILNVKIMAKEV